MTNRSARSSRVSEPRHRRTPFWAHGRAYTILAFGLAMAGFLLSIPFFLTWKQEYEIASAPKFFPVTVDPATKTITTDPAVEALLSAPGTPFTAAVLEGADILSQLAAAVTTLPVYEALYAGGSRYVEIPSGVRKEQLAAAFGSALNWSTTTQKTFTEDMLTQPEGTFSPGTYILPAASTPADVEAALTDRFTSEVLVHYATSTADVVPLSEALTIASMIERESKNKDDMRVISGILWNRLFAGMRLQVDPTVQYAKATNLSDAGKKTAWWPALTSRDMSIKSPYNTYANTGLPPAPISEPSVFAILAALNPTKTSCLYYFHDSSGVFHCADTYTEHVALLKKYYGQGK